MGPGAESCTAGRRGKGLTLGLIRGCLVLQLACLQGAVKLHSDDVYLGLTVLQHLLGCQQQFPVLPVGKGSEGQAGEWGLRAGLLSTLRRLW